MGRVLYWLRGGLTWKELGKRVYEESDNDDVFGRAAQLSYYFLLALFPLLLVCLTVIGMLAGGTDLRDALIARLSAVMPVSASELVTKTVEEITAAAGGSKLSLGLLGALWAASNGMTAVGETLNVAYDVKEGRGWVKRKLVAVGLTVALAVLMVSALVLTLQGHNIIDRVGAAVGLSAAAALAWKIVQWPIVVGFMLLAFALVYHFAPDIRSRSWKWVTPGAVVGVTLWILASLAFRLYLSHFDSYAKTYGSLGAVIVLMLWFYVTGVAILVGGEVNSEIEHAAAERGAVDAKARGEKAPGEKDAGVAEPAEKPARGKEKGPRRQPTRRPAAQGA